MSAALAQLTAGLTPQQLLQLKDENHDAEVYTCAAVFSALAIIAVILRVTSRHMKKVAFGVDDALITAALVRPLINLTFFLRRRLLLTVLVMHRFYLWLRLCTYASVSSSNPLRLFQCVELPLTLVSGVQRFGLGRHLWTLTPDQFVNFNKVINCHHTSRSRVPSPSLIG